MNKERIILEKASEFFPHTETYLDASGINRVLTPVEN